MSRSHTFTHAQTNATIARDQLSSASVLGPAPLTLLPNAACLPIQSKRSPHEPGAKASRTSKVPRQRTTGSGRCETRSENKLPPPKPKQPARGQQGLSGGEGTVYNTASSGVYTTDTVRQIHHLQRLPCHPASISQPPHRTRGPKQTHQHPAQARSPKPKPKLAQHPCAKDD